MIDQTLINETLRYLGIQNASADESLTAMVKRALERVESAANKQFVVSCVNCRVEENGVWLDTHFVQSRNLANHLETCEEALLFAATLGAAVDRLLRRDTVTQPSLAAIEQAAAAALIEAYSDDVCRSLETQQTQNGVFHFRPRYSPGYGDFSLEEQTYLLQILQTNKRIGLTHTDACMLVPSKSITAVIGIAQGEARCYVGGCQTCSKKDCAFRKQ